MSRTVECTPATRAGRRAKARQFLDQAEAVLELADDAAKVADAYVTLLVHAGIAAADVICCAALGIHAQGENHNEAITLLAKADSRHAKDLQTLLGVKTKAGYSAIPVSNSERTRATRAAGRLVDAAEATR